MKPPSVPTDEMATRAARYRDVFEGLRGERDVLLGDLLNATATREESPRERQELARPDNTPWQRPDAAAVQARLADRVLSHRVRAWTLGSPHVAQGDLYVAERIHVIGPPYAGWFIDETGHPATPAGHADLATGRLNCSPSVVGAPADDQVWAGWWIDFVPGHTLLTGVNVSIVRIHAGS
jgi:hypothetical protein